MDQATQQNAALVEEMAAAASGLKSQAQDLVQVVAAFRLSEADVGSGLPKAAVRSMVPKNPPFQGTERRTSGANGSASQRGTAKPFKATASPQPGTKVTAKATPAGGDEDWETF
jgi:hypothetical protein